MKFKYHGSVCSDLNDTRTFIDDVLSKVGSIIDNDNILFDLRLILSELIINGIEHGNKYEIDKCIYLYLEIVGDKMRIEVWDEGLGIDYERENYNIYDLKTCGRGLLLVSGLSDEVYIENNKVVALKSIY